RHLAGDDERPAHGQPQDQVGGRVVADVRHRLARGDEEAQQDARGHHQDAGAAGAHPTASAGRLPDNPPLGDNPRAPASAARGPQSLASGLDVSTIAGGSASRVSSAAIANPSMSGSCTSSSTTSGRSWRAATSADAPSTASPTIVYPSDWSSARAMARKLG